MDALSQSVGLALKLIAQSDATLWQIALLSLRVSGTAVLLGATGGLLLGAWLAVARFPGHAVVVGLLNTLLALPSVVVGLVVYLLLSRSGPLGSWGILFTPTAMVIAQSILVVPLIAALTRQLVTDALREGGDELAAMGAGRLLSALLLLAHARLAVLTVLLFTDIGARGSTYVVWFAVIYLLWGLAWTANDIPYWSMLPALTLDQRERVGELLSVPSGKLTP